jgi:hypothetical protein
MRPRDLVFCRVGDKSLHPAWVGDPATRSYDVWLDCYCDPAVWAGAPAKVTDGRGTTKWPRLADLLARDPAVFDAYGAIWVPDDDLAIDADGVERFLEIFHREGLSLAQPALADGCFWSHELTLAVRTYAVRFTNFVEVMAPAFSREALRACAPTFALSKSGWGLDYVWPRLLGDPPDRVGIVDATPMVHTRPVGGGGAYVFKEAEEEAHALTARHGVSLPFRYRQLGGVTRGRGGERGARIRGGLRFYARLLAGAPPSQRWRTAYWRLMRETL